MGVTGKRVEKSGIGGRAGTMAAAGATDLLYGSRGVPAAYHHPGSLDPHEPRPSGPGSPLLKPEKREDTRREDRVPTWRTSSPFVKDHVESAVISDYPRKNPTRSQVTAAAQGLGTTANAVRQNRPRGMQKRR